MRIEKMIVREMNMTMKSPFTTSFGSVQEKRFLIVEVYDEFGNCGYGEGEAFEAPWYTEETTATCWHMIEDFLAPLVLNREISHPRDVRQFFKPIRRNNMAKSAVECAVWDAYAKRINQPLWQVLGGTRQAIKVGVSIGLQPTAQLLYEKIDRALEAGYGRVKVKIKPGKDVQLLETIRDRYPYVPLMADANSAYTLDDMALLQQLDQFNLMMIEQPLAADDILNHAKLQRVLKTPICLDESINSYDDALTAIELGSCGVINVKQARVGGLEEARRIHDLCVERGIDIWCGGMLEAGIGRAHAVALTSLAGFTMPGDTAGSDHYWHEDIITPTVNVESGYVHMQAAPGIGYDVDRDVLEKYTVRKKAF
jgi:o-succinylbenzoate synthase